MHLPRSTLGNLVQGGTALLGTIAEAMWQDARKHAAWVAIDATGVLVLAAEQCRRGHFWVVVTDNGHVLFRYTNKHNGSVPVELLAGFRGYVIADASSVYHELYRSEPDIIEVCCWAHARRGLFDALTVDRERAMVGIGFIGLLYDAHHAATDAESGITDTPALTCKIGVTSRMLNRTPYLTKLKWRISFAYVTTSSQVRCVPAERASHIIPKRASNTAWIRDASAGLYDFFYRLRRV